MFLILCCGFWACGEEEEPEESGFQMYYINKEETAVVSEEIEEPTGTEEEQLSRIMELLQEPPKNPEYKRALPDTVSIVDYRLEKGQLYLFFDSNYQKMTKVYEVLCRTAVVRALCQLPQVDYVAFFVNDQSLADSNQMPVGLMNSELFIENTGDQINTFNSVTLDLYFSNATGDKLVKERDNFNYSSNMSLEKLVVEQLIQGPISEHAFPSIPPETKLLSITTKDGICYVNFDEGFLGQGYDVTEQVPIYSIVNSLSELSGVNKVQILINGETPKVYRESISFETIFERNFDILEGAGTQEEGQEDQESGKEAESEKESGEEDAKSGQGDKKEDDKS